MRRILNLTNVLFLATLILELFPSKRDGINAWYYIGLVLLLEIFYILNVILKKDEEKTQTIGDVTAIVYGVLIIWEIFTTKTDLADKLLFPSPSSILSLLISELPELLKGTVSSFQLLLTGYILALALAIPLALVIGWRKRLYKAINPLTKVFGPIPPIVYIPYAIAILPTFKAASIFIIFIGAFWPVFINTLNGVFNVDRRIIDSAKALSVSEGSMLFQVILPATLPSIISGATIGLVMSFILLTAAEMIGATSGLGWYVKYFSDFADYPRVIVGIIFIGVVVTGVTFLFDKIERYLLRWRK
ncbi:ABC transporter permease [Acetivibrio mesophilus]|uniref:ABC transporter permease subunit n=1 Tax=Acetivibrio mesophilus TaxID=2487273 RepID=A0A4Q0I343_9FIRM|nr:ABC transporter permease subunit [Acetivibrio mesophilus]ODM27696.1 ABC transporter permease [Clostridium sp. Bc-iso-3]RXE58638.1 ABC transporter permease subunit [Acetivibrio mesophilus]HHV30739.1 ABC transporter permease subunit [Clostridium sp.]